MYRSSEANQPAKAGYGTGGNANRDLPPRDRDESLIEAVLQGRTDAFADLVTPHLGSLTRFARMRLRNDSEAEDVVQQAVLRAFRGLGQFRREASFKTWLSTITFNEVTHLRRDKGIAPVSSLNMAPADGLADPSSLPDIQIQRQEERERLYRALTRLPEKYRAVIQLRDLNELSVAATARSLSLTVSAVKTRHHRARKLLLRYLDSGR